MSVRQILSFATGLILVVFAIVGLLLYLTAGSDDSEPTQQAIAATSTAGEGADMDSEGSDPQASSSSIAGTSPGTVMTCPDIHVETNAVSSTVTSSVKRVSLLTCEEVTDLVKGAFGYGTLEPEAVDEAEQLRQFAGGWTCEYGSGAFCWNVSEQFNVIRNGTDEQLLAISAPVSHG